VSTGETLQEARDVAYREMKKVSFEGMYYRSDIGAA
jgi:phosphoribosylamine--glycine ligase